MKDAVIVRLSALFINIVEAGIFPAVLGQFKKKRIGAFSQFFGVSLKWQQPS
jgi:hypothetical protein